MNTAEESKRLKKLRSNIIKQIPKFPNNKATKEFLEQKSLKSIFIDYINWASRYVPPRKRKIRNEPTATNDPRWKILRNEIDAFLTKVRNGDDLTPHLSLQAHKQGFTPASASRDPNVDKWADKDFLLNVMGFHHFHLGITVETAGHVTRTDEVLFAEVTRDQFNVVAIFDHTVFEKTDKVTKSMTAERDRLWDLFTKISSRGVSPGSVYVPSMIMTSGHSMHHVMLADRYGHVVHEIDSKIDDPSFVDSLYVDAGVSPPPRPKLKWHFNYLDLGLLDEAQNMFFIFQMGSK